MMECGSYQGASRLQQRHQSFVTRLTVGLISHRIKENLNAKIVVSLEGWSAGWSELAVASKIFIRILFICMASNKGSTLELLLCGAFAGINYINVI